MFKKIKEQVQKNFNKISNEKLHFSFFRAS